MHTKKQADENAQEQLASANAQTTQKKGANTIQAKQRPVQNQTKPTYQSPQGKKEPYQAKQRPVQRKESDNDLKNQMGQQYGVDLSGFKEHQNSSFPGSVNALATIQGKNIHYAPGQFTEKNRKHELGHAIDNTLNGTPKGDKTVNGQNIDTTREKVADKIADTPLQRKTQEGDLVQANTEGGVVQRVQHLWMIYGEDYEQQVYEQEQQLQQQQQEVESRKKKNVYKGGAELEYREGKAQMTFSNLPAGDAAQIKGYIREGMKGIDISSIGQGQAPLKGNNWALTVETCEGTTIDANGNIGVELELILGGPTGSTIAALKKAATESAEALKALDNIGNLHFGNIGNTIRDNVVNKYKKKAKADGEEVPVYGQEHPLGKDWSQLGITGTWDPQGGKPHEKGWGLQVTMAVPLGETHLIGQVLESKGLTDTSIAKPKEKEDIVWSGYDILDQWHKNGNAPQGTVLNQQTMLEKWNAKYDYDFNWENEDHNNKLQPLQDEFNAEKNQNLYQALQNKVQQTDQSKSAPSLATLNGLAKVLAAYVRGLNNGVGQGPKHNMQFVNKNPLPAVIQNAVSTMPASLYNEMRNACVDLILSKDGGTDAYHWRGKSLSLKDWGIAMKNKNTDLVAKNEVLYRSGQVGGLSSLNDISKAQSEQKDAPIIEFRDLGSKKPSDMAALFDSIIAKLG